MNRKNNIEHLFNNNNTKSLETNRRLNNSESSSTNGRLRDFQVNFLFGKILTPNPLNCKKCGSKNLRYTKGKACHGIQAWCRGCGASFPVAKVLAPYLQHLVEPDPPPETRVCRYCGKKATVIDADYYSCSGCGAGLLNFNFGGASHE